MATDKTHVRVAITGTLYLAPLSTVMPSDISTAPDAAFKDYGYVSEEGIVITPSWDTVDIAAWQSASPVRSVTRQRTYQIKATLVQSSGDITVLVYGGGAWTGSAGKWKFTPPVGGTSASYAMIFEYTDGASVKKRWCAPTVTVQEVGDISHVNNDAVKYPITLKIVGDDWFIQSNDTNDGTPGTGGGLEEAAEPSPDQAGEVVQVSSGTGPTARRNAA